MTATPGPCTCIDPEITGCQCGFGDTTTIHYTGSGVPGDPYLAEVNLSPDTTNRIYDDGTGLIVPVPGHLKTWADVDQTRASGDTIGFNRANAHDRGTAPGVSHDTGSGVNHVFTIEEDGWFSLKTQVTLDSAPGLIIGNIQWQNVASGDFLSQVTFGEAPWAVQNMVEEFFNQGDQLAVRLDFTGVSSLGVRGDGSTRGWRTWAIVRKIHGT